MSPLFIFPMPEDQKNRESSPPIIPELHTADLGESSATSKEKSHNPRLKKKHSKWISVLNYILNLVIIFLIVLLIRAFVIAPFQVSGESMTNTLDDKEYIIVNKLLYHGLFGITFGKPERGDIVVIEPPINKQIYYIKRIIGLPGETISFKGNNVIIKNTDHPDGFILQEEYVKCVDMISQTLVNNCRESSYPQKEFVIPLDSYFVMGDNRENSTDSRVCFQNNCNLPDASHFVKFEHIVGKTWFVIWPVTHIRLVPDVQYGS